MSLHYLPINTFQTLSQTPLLGPHPARALYLSVCPSVCLRILVRGIKSFPLAQIGPYFTHMVPLGKGYTETFNHVFRSKVNVIAELYEKFLSRAYLFSPSSNMTQTLLTEYL